jgi:DNA-binding CsgD family transcriptional regulator
MHSSYFIQTRIGYKNLILEKKNNKEIAIEIFIGGSAVKTHITNLYKKLKVVNSTTLVRRFKNNTFTST